MGPPRWGAFSRESLADRIRAPLRLQSGFFFRNFFFEKSPVSKRRSPVDGRGQSRERTDAGQAGHRTGHGAGQRPQYGGSRGGSAIWGAAGCHAPRIARPVGSAAACAPGSGQRPRGRAVGRAPSAADTLHPRFILSAALRAPTAA